LAQPYFVFKKIKEEEQERKGKKNKSRSA